MGPLVGNGASYSAIGDVELRILMQKSNSAVNIDLDPTPDSFGAASHWQFGTGAYSSDARLILAIYLPFTLRLISKDGTNHNLRQLVLKGSSQWIIGKNVNNRCDILHATEMTFSTKETDN